MSLMTKSSLLICSVVFACTNTQAVMPEVFDYLQKTLERTRGYVDEPWKETGGGYVFKVEMDVTGDGIPELFLSDTSKQAPRGSLVWQVYLRKGHGVYQPVVISESCLPWLKVTDVLTLNFYSDLILRKESNGDVSFIRWAKDGKSNSDGTLDMHYYLLSYTISGERAFIRRKELLYRNESEEDLAGDSDYWEGQPGNRRVTVDVEAILLADLLRYPKTPWRKIRWDDGVPSPEGLFLAKEDEERVPKLAAFTPTLAMQWLKTAAAGKEPSLELEPGLRGAFEGSPARDAGGGRLKAPPTPGGPMNRDILGDVAMACAGMGVAFWAWTVLRRRRC